MAGGSYVALFEYQLDILCAYIYFCFLIQRFGFETENLQSMALQLSVKARCLVAELKKENMEEESNKNIGSNKMEFHRQTPSVSVLTAVCDIISSLKPIITWLDR